jgi:hypothetical protein
VGGRKGGEMTQTLYAHMNKKKKELREFYGVKQILSWIVILLLN